MTIPFLLWTLVCATASLGTIAYEYQWRKIVSLQMKLDQTVGKSALELQDLMNRIERINSIMIQTRSAIAAQQMLGLPLAPATQAVLEAQSKIQDSLLLAWKVKNLLPILKWERPIPDLLGPQPLHWVGSPELIVKRTHFPRKASARVFKGALDGKTWNAEWADFY